MYNSDFSGFLAKVNALRDLGVVSARWHDPTTGERGEVTLRDEDIGLRNSADRQVEIRRQNEQFAQLKEIYNNETGKVWIGGGTDELLNALSEEAGISLELKAR